MEFLKEKRKSFRLLYRKKLHSGLSKPYIDHFKLHYIKSVMEFLKGTNRQAATPGHSQIGILPYIVYWSLLNKNGRIGLLTRP